MNPGPGPRLLVSAGEPSGDRLGGALVRSLQTLRPGLQFEGPGGRMMADAGVRIREPVDRLGALGFVEVLRTLPRHVALYRDLVRDARAGRFQGAVLIDYPGFHLRLGRALRRSGVPVLWYAAPQLWAWRPGRLPALRAAADRLALILPFEARWFTERGMSAEYAGSPLLDRDWPSREAARRELGIPLELPVLAIFPGAREGELSRNWPLFREVGKRLLAEGRACQVLVAGTAGGYYPDLSPLVLVRDRPGQVLAAATAALVKSGTTTLEAACTGTPMVCAYRSTRSTYALARRLMTVRWISLVNLVAGAPVVPEFWHLPVEPAPIVAALGPLLDPVEPAHRAQVEGLAAVRAALGERGSADRAARMLLELLPA